MIGLLYRSIKNPLKEAHNRIRVINFLMLLLSRVVVLLQQIFVIPLSLYLLGKNLYGEWLLISTLPNYMAISDLGVNITATTSICSLVAQNKRITALKVYQSSNTFIIIVGIITIIVYGLSTVFVSWNKFLGIKIIDEYTTELTLGFLLLSTFLSILIGLLIGIYRAGGKFHLHSLAYIIYFIMDFSVFLLIISCGEDFLSVSICQIIWRIFFIIYVSHKLSKRFLWFHFGFSRELKPITNLLPTSIYYMFYSIGQGLVLQGTTLIIGKNLGSASLVHFTVIRTLVNSIKSFTSIFYNSLLPEYTVLIANNKFSEAKIIFKKILPVSIFIIFLLAGAYYFGGEFLVTHWTKGAIKLEYPFYSIMLWVVIVSTISDCSYSVLNATNENRVVGIYYAFFSIIVIIAIYKLAHLGLEYVATCLLILEIVILGVVLRTSWKVLSGKSINIII